MATSGKLAEDLSVALAIPRASIQTMLQVLRQAGMVSTKGRGLSAAEMSSADAAALLVALATHASAPFVSRVTGLLLDMDLRVSQTLAPATAEHVADWTTRKLKPGGRFSFSTALINLIQRGAYDPDEPAPGQKFDDPLANPGKVGVWIGVDGQRSGGFGLVRVSTSDGTTERNLYSTWGVRKSVPPSFDLLNFFEGGPRYFSITYYSGDAIACVVESLNAPIGRPRKRGPRIARSGRGS
jgi:hypothetical protein